MHEGRPFFYLLALRKCCGVQPAMRELMIIGLALIVFAVVMNVWAVASYKKIS